MKILILSFLLIWYLFIDAFDYIFGASSKWLIITVCSLLAIKELTERINHKNSHSIKIIIFFSFLVYYFFLQSLFNPLLAPPFFYRISGLLIFLFTVNTLKEKDKSVLKFKRMYILLVKIISIGIVVDYIFPNILQPIQKYDIERSYFLLGTSSNIFISLSPGMYLVLNKNLNFSKLLWASIFLIACLLSGSRLALFSILILLFFAFKIHKSRISILFLIGLILYYSKIIFTTVNSFILIDSGNSRRLIYWKFLIEEIGFMNLIQGYGLGYLSTSLNAFQSEHFESSFILLIIEGGVLFTIYLLTFWLTTIYKHSNKLLLMLFFVTAILVPIFPGPLFGMSSGLLVLTKKGEINDFNNNSYI